MTLSCKSFLISERFVSRSIVWFLNQRGVLNKWQQQDSTCDVCMYNYASEVNFCGENVCRKTFCGNYVLRELFLRELLFANHDKNKLKKSQI